MAVRGQELDDRLAPLLRDGRDGMGDVDWFDAHTHMGHNDPDGFEADPQDVVAGLDRAGHARALIFAMHEPDGYVAANDAVLAATRASEGRLQALCRVAPGTPGALDEARRCLDAGARGIKLHPRSDAFTLPHPVVDALVALAAQRRLPVLFHAGRGIPNLGAAAAALAHDHPGARIILAHCGISDLGLLAQAAAELPNLFFDTAWWQVSDVLELFATVPPGQILYASDMPYGPGSFAAFSFLRCARAVGLGAEAVRSIAGEQLARVVAGEERVDLGPAPGARALGERALGLERAVAYTSTAVQMAFKDADATEPIALARLACQTAGGRPVHARLLARVDELLALAQEARAASPDAPMAGIPAVLCAMVVAGTPQAGVPAGVTRLT